ncbi:MAG: CHASE2 domain-containing protein, partial [Candidatus Dadabacteria bacterium]|nr:CHASE2 domain-containing protein [Candidatus Dadabacteria bacterium]NIQ13194.1 CHASE2 domain-containing protein [Candidatus Dadabacteria bacterium]
MNIKRETLINILVVTGIFLIVSFVLCFLSFSDNSSIGSFLDEIDDRFGDSRFEWREKSGDSPKPSEDVVILVVDENSVNELGRWPWSRKLQAEILQSIYNYKPKVVALDIVNSEKLDDQEDVLLGQTIKSFRNTVLGYFYRYNEPTEDNSESFKYVKRSKINIIKTIEEPDKIYSDNFWRFKSVEVNIPEIGKNARSHGFFNFKPDDDGIFRKAILLTKFNGSFYPSLNLEGLRKFVKGQLILSLDKLGIEGLFLNDLEIPITESGSFVLNYYGEGGTIPTYSIIDVLNKKIPDEKLKDKLVFVGVTEIGVYDIRPSPLDG